MYEGTRIKPLPEGLKIIDENPTCKVCNKIGVCGIFQAIFPLMNNWKATEKPFEVDELGRICRYFARKYEENL